ncbi:MAG: ribonuclease R [Bdellovibrio sp.]
MKKLYTQIGLVKRHADGFGFLISESPEAVDVYIPRSEMRGLMTQDRVELIIHPEPGGERFRGELKKIISRSTRRIVGTLRRLASNQCLVLDESHAWGEDLRIDSSEIKTARDGELVEAEILSYANEAGGFRGRVVEVLGQPNDPWLDIKKVLIAQNVPHQFPSKVEEESKTYVTDVRAKDFPNRRNLCSLPFVTIDGATAKDFDDAILVQSDGQGFRLYVAIADVSHYVRPGSAIDQEAYLRGTSTYFPNFVVPMLPEVLSNELCSLKPGVPRLSLVVEMSLDFNGQIHEKTFYEAVIQSHARITYGEAQDVLDSEVPTHLQNLAGELRRAGDLARILMRRRFQKGSLDLEVPEVELLIDAQGMPVDVVQSERLFAHRLIEELMLAANISVAEILASKNVPTLYRIHDAPKTDALEVLQNYAESFGHRIHLAGLGLQKKINRILENSHGKPEGRILHMLTLRSMAQAKYSPLNIGHFGLGFEEYCHFTSPIRRYPDLIVHRNLKSLLPKSSGAQRLEEEELLTAGNMLSACEQRSVKAERQVESIKKARFIEKHLGEEFDGHISSVLKFGVFVLLREFEIDGLIRIENLAKEPLVYDEDHLKLVGKRSGVSFGLGELIRVRVESVQVESGQIDFVPSHLEASRSQPKQVSQPRREDNKASNFTSRKNRDPKSHRPKSKTHSKKNPDRRKHGAHNSDEARNKHKGPDKNEAGSRDEFLEKKAARRERQSASKADSSKNQSSRKAKKSSRKKGSANSRRGWSIPISHR